MTRTITISALLLSSVRLMSVHCIAFEVQAIFSVRDEVRRRFAADLVDSTE